MFYFSILLLVLFGRSKAACQDNLVVNLEVTGDVKVNGTIYTVRTKEYATFTCTATALGKVESGLIVDCDGSNKKTIKKSGEGSSAAKYQTNDDCMFNSKCTITCSAKSPCAETETQEYMLLKSNVGIINSTNVNCTDINTNKLCINASFHINMVQVKICEPEGKLSGESTCTNEHHWNTSTINIFYVLPPVKKCSCSSTFKFWEMTSKGVLCPDPVYTKIIETRVEEYCNDAEDSKMRQKLVVVVIIVVIILVILGFIGFIVTVAGHRTQSAENAQKKTDETRLPVLRSGTGDGVQNPTYDSVTTY